MVRKIVRGREHSVITVTGVRHQGLYVERYSYLEWEQHFIFDALELTRNIIIMAPEQKIKELKPGTDRNFKFKKFQKLDLKNRSPSPPSP